MGREVRPTLQTQRVLRVFLSLPEESHYGLELAKSAGLPTGTIYPILARLEGAGWVRSTWEDIDEAAEGRRRRRYYQVTGKGQRNGRALLEETRRLIFPDAVQEPA